MLKEVSLTEALQRYKNGQEVYLIDDRNVITLQKIIALGFRCLVEEAAAEEKKAKEKEAPPQPKGGRMDRGKIMALWDAGWKVKDIAGEMGKEYKAIYQVVHSELKKRGEEE